MSMGSSSTLSRTETLISCEKGHIRLLAAPDSEGGWQLTVHAEGEEPLEE